MSDPMQSASSDEPNEISVDLTKIAEDIQEKANVVINQYQEKANDPKTRQIASAVFGICFSTGLTYFAAKRGAKAGMKDFVNAGQDLINAAGTYANVAEENARSSYDAVRVLTEATKSVTKAIKKN